MNYFFWLGGEAEATDWLSRALAKIALANPQSRPWPRHIKRLENNQD